MPALSLLFLSSDRHHPALPSSPTRRSSDLVARARQHFHHAGPTLVLHHEAPRHGHRHYRLAVFRWPWRGASRSEEHTSELQSLRHLVCRLLLEKKKTNISPTQRNALHLSLL